MTAQRQIRTEPSIENTPLPHSLEAERAVLGGILLREAHFDAVAEILRPDDFFLDSHRVIFAAMMLMERDWRPIDLMTVVEEIRAQGRIEEVGGAAYLSSLVDGVPRLANVTHYARIVKEKSDRRGIISLSNQAIGDALGNTERDDILGRFDDLICSMRDDGSAGQSAMRVGDIVREVRPNLERVGTGAGAILGTPTGYRDLDAVLAGWVPSDLVVLAARPSLGKTAFSIELARRQAEAGNATAIFSLEMSGESLVTRLACLLARIDNHALRTGRLNRDQWNLLSAALDRLSDYPIWIDDRPAVWHDQIRARVRSLAQRYKVKLVVVDYMQLLRAKAENRTQEVSAISGSLKAAARELGNISGGTLLAISQLSRLAADEEPQLHHLRESGAIEQDADSVMFIWHGNDSDIVPGQVKPYKKVLKIAKQRNGPLANIDLMFLPVSMGFEPCAFTAQNEREEK